MRRYRLSRLAEIDFSRILTTSEERWGTQARRRYAAIILAAIRKIADDPTGPTTRDRVELSTGLRSFHIRNARSHDRDTDVKHPVHVLYYRAVGPDLIEIVRMLHERMEPSQHLSPENSK
jgi:toxin ParE1/3/4